MPETPIGKLWNSCWNWEQSNNEYYRSVHNLAIAFGQIEKKVLLIDCDLRAPTIAQKLGIKGAPGLSDLLVGRNCRLRQLTDVGICVLPSGTLPPVTTVADAAILAKHADGFLLAIRHRCSRYRAIADMLEHLALADANVLGYIYTNAADNGGHYYYGYGYGRHRSAPV